MGYETKLIIGRASSISEEYAVGDLILEDGEAYRPLLRDNDDNLVMTGKKECYFQVYATIDLCKCGYNSSINEIGNLKPTDILYYFYGEDGNTAIKEDRYNEKFNPVSIDTAIDALEVDMVDSDYRRFKWALDLLKSMKSSSEGEELLVIHYGY